MQAPFNSKLKKFLRNIKDPEKREIVQHVFLSDKSHLKLNGLSIKRVNEAESTKLAS
jgi:hypothetical protein